MSKKLEVKQRRRQEAERRQAERRAAARKRNLFTLAAILVVVAAVGAAILFQGGDGASSIAGTGECEDIETFEEANTEENRQHIDEGIPGNYETDPPVYGPHWPPGSIADPGFYSDPVEPERVVHNMEHGQVVIYYSDDASEETIEKIEQLVEQEEQATIATPYDGLDSTLVFAAWGALQRCDEPGQKVADDFRRRFQGRGPENVGIPTFE